MKLIFRVTYHTVPGESLWLVLSLHDPTSGMRLRETHAMQWHNPEHWQSEVEIDAAQPVTLEYHYQLRRAHNQSQLDEWQAPRRATIDPGQGDAHVFLDDWRCAGTVDYLYETRAFPDQFEQVKPIAADNATHQIRLHMAALPDGRVPCVLGEVEALGNWQWHRATPLQRGEGNLWHTRLTLPTHSAIAYKFGLYDPATATAVGLECGGNRVLLPHHHGERQLTVVSCERYHREDSQLVRTAGVAVPVFSLRGNDSLGIGEFADLVPFADWAADAGFKMIQILPINDTTSAHDWTDSYPYSAISVHALHPIYLRLGDLTLAKVSPDMHAEINAVRQKLNPLDAIDHTAVMAAKTQITRAIFASDVESITRAEVFQTFLAENREWLIPYAAFCVLRDEFRTADFRKWRKFSTCNLTEIESWASPNHPRWQDIAYHIWLQCELDAQLTAAVTHLHKRGLALKGDLPIGIDRHSVDAWASPHLFHLDAQCGAPPDAFAVKGQNWGFPTYNWHIMRRDHFAWWRTRFAKLSRYFDAYRIDHILGFFRIWQIPTDHVEGIMGWFDPATPIHLDEIHARGINFDFLRHCRPYIRDHHLDARFGPEANEARAHYLEACGHGIWKLRDHVATQSLIRHHFADWDLADPASRARAEKLRQGLYDCAAEVLFLEQPGSGGTRFHPRCAMHHTLSFQELPYDQKERLTALSNDYFYHRQEGLWESHALELLPVMRAASPMLLCGEDLGMVPACLPAVLRELGILSLEIQRMPKSSAIEFFDPAAADYLSVVSPSTHDMATLRMWWREDAHATARFAWQFFHQAPPPADLDAPTAARIIAQHLASPAMWAILPIQDLLAMDETLRREDADAERINIPAIMPFYWRYRLHLATDTLAKADAFNTRLREMIQQAQRI